MTCKNIFQMKIKFRKSHQAIFVMKYYSALMPKTCTIQFYSVLKKLGHPFLLNEICWVLLLNKIKKNECIYMEIISFAEEIN